MPKNSFSEIFNRLHFDKEIFFKMVMMGWIVDGRAGGYVIGRSHDDGSVYMIMRTAENDIFTVSNCLEGGEYVVNYKAYLSNKTKIERINSFKESHEFLPHSKITLKTRVINTYSEPYDKLLLIDKDQFIINKFATAYYYNEIENINNSENPYLSCNLDLLCE